MEINLRKLEEKDAPYMIEWMHDSDITAGFQADFAHATIESVTKFINNSFDDESQHFAIVNEYDEYLGTISLKHICHRNDRAEYAIVTRKNVHGTGVAKEATEKLIKYAFEELKLHKVYLSCLRTNVVALKFYEKCGFVQEGIDVDAVKVGDKYVDHIWYGMISK